MRLISRETILCDRCKFPFHAKAGSILAIDGEDVLCPRCAQQLDRGHAPAWARRLFVSLVAVLVAYILAHLIHYAVAIWEILC